MAVSQQSWHLGEAFPIRVMALMLRDIEFLPKYRGDIEHHYFEKKDLCTLAYLILRFFEQRGKIPLRDEVIDMITSYAGTYDADGTLNMRETLCGWLDFCLAYTIGDEDFIKERVRKFAVYKKWQAAIVSNYAAYEAATPEDDPYELGAKTLALYEAAFRPGATSDMGELLTDISADLSRLLREDSMYGQANKVPTGIMGLDEALRGGLGCPELGVLAGAPGVGKSTNLCVLGANAARFFMERHRLGGYKVLKTVIHITCEISRLDVEAKYMANLLGMSLDELQLLPDRYTTLHNERIGQFGPIKVKYFVPGSTTVEEVKWFINQLVMEGVTPGLIIVDYADRLKGGEEDRFVGMGKIYDGLIAINNKFKCPTWTASQINRNQSGQAIANMAGLAESWKKCEAADVIVTLNQTPEARKANLLALYDAKVRRGKTGDIIHCHYFPDRAQLTQMTDEEIKKHGLDQTEQSEDMGDRVSAKIRSVTKKKAEEDAKKDEVPPATQPTFTMPAHGVVPGAPPAPPSGPLATVEVPVVLSESVKPPTLPWQ